MNAIQVESKAEKGPLMTSPYLGNRDKTFWSSLGRGSAGHPRIWSHEITPWLTQQKMQKGIHDAQL